MSLHATIQVELGTLDLDATVTVSPGEVVAVLGPNGSGKSTLLSALAGLVPLHSGRVVLDGAVVEDPAQRIRQPAAQRSVGLAFQDYLLFPHLSVQDNVAFSLRARGGAKAAARKQAHRWLEALSIADLAQEKPGSLSGGQAQRVALARALASEPRLLLLDEPLAALDAGTKLEVRRELTRHLADFAGMALLVTHNPLEAAGLADRQIILEQGRVVQHGTAAEIAERPRSRYVAELVGLNLVKGLAHDDHVRVDGGGVLKVPSAGTGEVFAAIHPRAVSLYREPPAGSPRNIWQGRVKALDVEGDRVRVSIDGQVPVIAEVTSASIEELGLSAADSIWVSIKATEIQIYPA